MAINIKPIQQKRMTVRIVGTSPLQQHQWDEKAKRMMREKQAGKKSKEREVRDPQAEFEAATYRTEKGKYGFPGMALKRAIIAAAHKDLGIEKTMVRKALFLHIPDPGGIIEMDCKPPRMREDMMRVGMGSVDLRYRPEFEQWAATVDIEFDSELLTDQDVITLIDRAGFGVGIGEGRPEVGRDFGRFKVDADFGVNVGKKQGR
jgi:hypothetical protein